MKTVLWSVSWTAIESTSFLYAAEGSRKWRIQRRIVLELVAKNRMEVHETAGYSSKRADSSTLDPTASVTRPFFMKSPVARNNSSMEGS